LLSSACGVNERSSSPDFTLQSDTVAHLEVPQLRQYGTRSNCGPTAAAMVLGAYEGVKEEKTLEAFRDEIGDWSYERFAMRRLRLPGISGGMTPADVLEETLNHFSKNVRFKRESLTSEERRSLGFIESNKTAVARLQAAMKERRPMLALVQSGVLWPETAESLHWVVVTGLTRDQVLINDPADGNSDVFSLSLFLASWRLNPFFRSLPFVDSYVGIVGDTPLSDPVEPEDELQLVSDATNVSTRSSPCRSNTVRR
jgi:hypothetical protein